MVQRSLRWPAEWEPQAGILVAWPHAQTDWATRIAAVESSYIELVTAISHHESCLICIADASLHARARDLLVAAGAHMQRVEFVQVPYDDTWLRDSGPIVLRDGSDYEYADFRFTGWGGKFGAEQDDALIGRLLDLGVFVQGRHARHEFALEGGALEGDGAGTLLTTWRCLHQRHPLLDRDTLERMLCLSLGAQRVLWLHHGYLEGDDTDAHIDTLARFSPDGGIVFQACDDPDDVHYAELGAMRDELAALRDPQGRPYRLHALPWARPIRDGRRRLAASYANYLVINDAVLVPGYGDPADAQAAHIIAAAHPGRRVMQIPCRALIWQNGSLHCVTMQIPAGALRGRTG